MSNRRESLDRLRVVKPCSASWADMSGDGSQRHCAACDRPVYDLALLTPEQIARLIVAENGRLCGRITQDPGGHLVTRWPALPSSGEVTRPAPRRLAGLAAALAAGLVGLPVAATEPVSVPAQSGEEAPAIPATERPAATGGASLFGRAWATGAGDGFLIRATNSLDGAEFTTHIAADGSFVLLGLPSGIYQVIQEAGHGAIAASEDVLLHSGERRQVELSQEGFTIIVGDVAAPPFSLRTAFETSELVVAALLGETVGVKGPELRSELFPLAQLKGEVPAEGLVVEHHGNLGEFERGAEVLAFLERDEKGAWKPANWGERLEIRSRPWIADHQERLEALAGLDPEAPGYSAELLDWLVTTTVQPETREGAVHDLVAVVESLESLVERRGTSVEYVLEDLGGVVARFEREGGRIGRQPRLDWLATFLDGARKRRLTRALVQTLVLRPEDLALFDLVARWDRTAAVGWLQGRLQNRVAADDYVLELSARRLSADPGHSTLAALVEEWDGAEGDEREALWGRIRGALGR